jgi:hypothetical protein
MSFMPNHVRGDNGIERKFVVPEVHSFGQTGIVPKAARALIEKLLQEGFTRVTPLDADFPAYLAAPHGNLAIVYYRGTRVVAEMYQRRGELPQTVKSSLYSIEAAGKAANLEPYNGS